VRVGRLVVDGGVDDAVADGQGGGDQLDGAAGAEQVAEHALGAGEGQPAGVLAEDLLDGVGLGGVPQRRAGAVGVDVLDVLGVESGVAQGEAHGHGGAGPVGVRGGDVVGV